MKALTKRIFALVGVLALGLSAVRAQDTALIDALVKKGVLSDQEAEDIRADIAKEYSTTSAGKISIASYITNLQLYGDARLRYEHIDDGLQSNAANKANGYAANQDRYRYRIRVGADYTFTDNFKAGFELESATAADSANQSLGSGYSKYPINVGLLYLQWKPTDWATLTGGKQRNPIYTTDLVWDPDINPEGASEVLSWTMPIDFGSDAAPATTDAKDMKTIAPVSEPSEMSLTIGFTAFQGIYADNNEGVVTTTGTLGTTNPNLDNTDVWQFVEQIPIQFNIDKTTFIKEVPGFDTYLGGGNNNLSSGLGAFGGSAVYAGQGGTQGTYVSSIAANDLQIITAPGEFDWKAFDIPFRAYWDFAYNLDGRNRVQNVYLQGNDAETAAYKRENNKLGDNIAWLAGLQIGQNKKKGDWSIKGDFRQTGIAAVDPNENDSDFANSDLNMQGIKIQSVYNFTDFLTGSIAYYNTWNLKRELFDDKNLAAGGVAPGTAATGNLASFAALDPINTEQRVQVDMIWKF